MATSNTTENNVTESLDVMNGLDMGLGDAIQSLLTILYTSQFGSFFATQIFGIPLAQLLAGILVLLLFLFLRSIFTNIVSVSLQKLASKSPTHYDNKVIAALKAPIRFVFVVIGLHLFFHMIFYNTDFIKNTLNTLVVFTIFWAIISVLDALRGLLYHATEKISKDLSREIGDFAMTIIKILVGGVGLGAMLQVWGINVTALVASLGIGGLAFALAAKDTAANLFGSFSVLADKSIRIGEWIKVDGVEGTVENIGMRTTKVRSFQKSLITVPNQIIANNPIENFSRRGIRRIKMNIGVTYDTSSAQIAAIVNEVKSLLQGHKGISQDDTMLVSFESFGDSALNILVYTFTNTANWQTYLEIREDVSMKIMKIVEDNGSAFAFPSQSLYVESMPS